MSLEQAASLYLPAPEQYTKLKYSAQITVMVSLFFVYVDNHRLIVNTPTYGDTSLGPIAPLQYFDIIKVTLLSFPDK